MGEIAEMMLDGTMCQSCGEWLNGGADGDGFPGFCASCQPIAKPKPLKVKCSKCGKLVKKAGLVDHIRAVHGKAGKE